MATTSLKIKNTEGTDVNLMFLTSQLGEDIITVNVYKADEEFNPQGTASVSIAKFPSEEAYHKELRKDAIDKGHFIPEYSTNPEWNPGYVESNDDDHEFQGDLHQ